MINEGLRSAISQVTYLPLKLNTCSTYIHTYSRHLGRPWKSY